MGKWDGARLERFQEALLDAFPSRVEFERLILFGLNEDLDTIASDNNLQAAVFEVLKWAKARGKLERLLEEARRRNRDNPILRDFAEQRAPFLVPFAMDPEFVGRDADLERLNRLLRNGTIGVRRAALVGMGGVGKTQLAVEYAHRRRSDYPGGVYWVNAAAPLVAELGALAERLGLREDTTSEAERPVQRLRAFERHLQEHPGALVILDNVADPLSLREPTAGIIPWELPCDLLFTTRRRDSDAPFESVSVGVLSEDAALRLLLSSKARRSLLEGGRADEIQAARAICGALGHLPLAIVLAAAYLGKSPGLALSDYLQRLRREGGLTTTDAAKVDPLRLATQHAAVVEATLRAQWDALATPEARHALKVAALLRNAAHVSRATLAHLTGLSDEAKNGYPAPLEQALNELSEWSLVEELTQKAIRLHPLVREFAAARIEQREAFAAACARQLGEALGEAGRLDAEVRARGLDAVLADLRLGEELVGAEGRERFRRLLRPLDREAHCLRRWDPVREPGFFLQQVRNVSFELGIEEMQEQAEATLKARRWTWLRERLRTSRESDALVRTLAGHTSSVWGVAVMPDGRSAISASHDGTLKVWEISSGCELRTLAGHASEVNGVAVTPDGSLAVSASEDGTLKVWELASGRERHTLVGHASSVYGVAVTPDGRLAISASADSTLKVWDLTDGREVRTLTGHGLAVNGVVVTPGGRLVISASEDSTIKVWELANGREVRTLAGHTDSVMEVAVTPDGRLVVSASADSTLRVWDLSSGRELRTLAGHDGWVAGVAVTPDGRLAISASDHTLKVWDLSSGREIHTLAGHSEPVKEVAVTPDGRLAISASHDNTLKVWELSSGRAACAHEGHTGAVPGVAVTSDGRLAVSASWDRTLKVWELSSRALVRTLKGHTSLVMRVAVTPDGRFAVSASEDKTLKVWKLPSGREVRTLAGHTWSATGVAVIPNGRWIVSASSDNTLRVWELSSGREIRTLAGHTLGVTGVAVTPDGCLAVSASEDATLKVWELSSGREVRTLAGHTLGVTGVAVTPDGHLVISASEDKTLKVWDLATGRGTYTLTGHTSTVTGVAVTPDGRLAVSTSEDATLRVWDLSDGSCIATLEAHAPLLSCAVDPDGCTFLAGDGAGSLHVLDWLSPSAEARGPLDSRLAAVRDATEARPQHREFNPGLATRHVPVTTNILTSSVSGAPLLTSARGTGVPAVPAATTAEPVRPPASDRIKILILASNPNSTTPLHLTREVRRIEDRLGVGKHRDAFELVTRWAVRRSDLQRLLLEEKPHVLHISSHGSTRAQLFLEDDEGNAAPVSKKALADLIGILKHRLRLVVLNACDTEPLAKALVQHVECAIGMRQAIGDDAAIAFAVSFYQALAFHEPVARAFRLACNELKLQQIPEEQTPILRVMRGVDAATLVLRGQQ
ncbi:effector-associated domain EAD1-containing protein [Sorangium sp. So ce385]|uniref:effector-associated domain EAD1-containing protein n=1 Tax=Sorangium sp. So ce385 TaxID=3133308 RepID=UPI003F5AEDD2